MLLQLEALAVGALHHSGVGLMGAHLDGVQAAVLAVLAVMGAVVHGALNTLVGAARAAAVGAVSGHGVFLPHKDFYTLNKSSARDFGRSPFRLTARHAFDSVALVCAAAGKLCIAFAQRKFFTGGRVRFAVF